MHSQDISRSAVSHTAEPDLPPATYALPRYLRKYVDDMRLRARLRLPANPPIYVSRAPNLCPHVNLDRLARTLTPCHVTDYAGTFTDPQDYAQRWPDVADTLAGLVVALGKSQLIGHGVLGEVLAAQERHVPILVYLSAVKRPYFVPIVDCQVAPLLLRKGHPRVPPWLAGRILTPARDLNRNTLAVTLAAMGVRRG